MVSTLCRLPFEWKSPIGYSIAILLQYWGLGQCGLVAAALISLEIGLFFLLMELIKDFEHDMKSTDEKAKSKEYQPELKQRLGSSIRFHSNVKELS